MQPKMPPPFLFSNVKFLFHYFILIYQKKRRFIGGALNEELSFKLKRTGNRKGRARSGRTPVLPISVLLLQ